MSWCLRICRMAKGNFLSRARDTAGWAAFIAKCHHIVDINHQIGNDSRSRAFHFRSTFQKKELLDMASGNR